MFVARSHTAPEIKLVKSLLERGLSDRELSRRTGISRSTIQRWRTMGFPQRGHDQPLPGWRPSRPESYSYLLGIYLGDGYISKAASSPVLEISLDARYPGIADECIEAVWQVLGVSGRSQFRATAGGGSIRIVAGSQLWPVVFPQHGPGKKHERAITLTDWQRRTVDRWPKPFVRGLIHSDGSRSINRFTVRTASGSREYAYARYFFTNLSADIRGLFCASCDRLEIAWTRSSPKNISISNRPSVELLDSFVGPKA
jgi:hypothetical protein